MSNLTTIEVYDYEGLQLVMRERAEEIGVSRLTIDDVSGLPAGYSAKLLCVPPIKHMGLTSLGPMLQTLGLKLLVTEDPVALAKVSNRLTPRKSGKARPSRIDKIIEARVSKLMAEKGKRGARILNESLSAAERKASARHASRARWAKKARSG